MLKNALSIHLLLFQDPNWYIMFYYHLFFDIFKIDTARFFFFWWLKIKLPLTMFRVIYEYKLPISSMFWKFLNTIKLELLILSLLNWFLDWIFHFEHLVCVSEKKKWIEWKSICGEKVGMYRLNHKFWKITHESRISSEYKSSAQLARVWLNNFY